MGELIKRILTWAIGAAIGRVVAGIGFTVIAYAGLQTLLTSYLNSAKGALAGVDANVLDILLLANVDDALSILGSAALARMAIVSAGNLLGVKIGQQ